MLIRSVKCTANNDVFTKINNVDSVRATNSNDNKITDVDVVASNYFSTLRTKSIIEPPMRYNAFPEIASIPKALEMDFSRILHKPFFVKNVDWTTTNTKWNLLNRITIPNDIFVSKLAKIPFNAATMYRCKVSLMLQVSGTSMHQGIVLAAAVPIGTAYTGTFSENTFVPINTFMAAPHVFINANEANAVMLEVPFYSPTKLLYCRFPGDLTSSPTGFDNFADVHLYVINPLFAPASASATLTISVYAMFTHLEFYTPHIEPTWTPLPTVFESEGLIEDLQSSATKAIDGVFRVTRNFAGDVLDSARSAVRHFTGLHSPNYPELIDKSAVVLRQNQNAVDVPSQYEKLDPYFKFDRILRDTVFDTDIDEMDVLQILSKPQYIGTFVVTSSDTAGTLCWSRPITPLMEVNANILFDNQTSTHINVANGTSLQRTLALLSRYWKGGLKVHIQSCMSNFHFCKLSVARNYSTNGNQFANYPAFADVTNLLTEVVEFSGGGQVQTIDMPYCSVFNQLPVTPDWRMNSMEHGMYYIYLNQPLVVNGTVSPTIYFNVYLSVDKDFQLYGYSTIPLGVTNLAYGVTFEGEDEMGFVSEAQATVVINDQSDILLENSPRVVPGDLVEHRPIESVRDWTRRMHSVSNETFTTTDLTNTGYLIVKPISALLGDTQYSNSTPVPVNNTMANLNSVAVLKRLFFGYRGGLKIKIVITGCSNAKCYFVPPGFARSTDAGAWIASVPYPQYSAQPGALAMQVELNSQYSILASSIPLTPIIRTAQTVSQERPNYLVSNTNILQESADNPLSANACELELEVPYMSPYRFAGSARNIFYNLTTAIPASTSLGHLSIVVAPDIGTAGAINVEYFISVDDTARFGYQVMAPYVSIPGARISVSDSYMAIPYVNSNASVRATPPPTPELDGSSACYYTKSV